jgi:hypothetical protein
VNEVLPHGPWRTQNHPGISLVLSKTTQDRLGQRLDRPFPITDHAKKRGRGEGSVPPLHTAQGARTNCASMDSPRGMDSPRTSDPDKYSHHPYCLQMTPQGLQRRGLPPIPRASHLGPHHRTQTQCPQHSSVKDLPPHPARTRRTQEVCHRTPSEGLYLTIKKPICGPLLLH